MEPVGIYISVPFCRAKCTFCNFASDAFGLARLEGYVDRLCGEIGKARMKAAAMGAELPERVDTVYFGGGTPSLLEAAQVERIFRALRGEFGLEADAEVTLECAPGQLSQPTLDAMQREGMSRVSLGVQSFVDAEAKAAGRLHTRAMCLEEIQRLQAAGIERISVDLIVGLALQTEESWRYSVDEMLASRVGHGSVYMLEVDEESRLGKEALRGGERYSASSLPDEDAVAEWYLEACERLDAAGMRQYEISNFAREGERSRHNIKYWRRQPYIGFGLDAHSMLRRMDGGAVRFRNGDDLGEYMSDLPMYAERPEVIGREAAFEEAVFLGMRMNEGVSLAELQEEFETSMVTNLQESMFPMQEAGMVWVDERRMGLTAQGRVVSNEVFERVLVEA